MRMEVGSIPTFGSMKKFLKRWLAVSIFFGVIVGIIELARFSPWLGLLALTAVIAAILTAID